MRAKDVELLSKKDIPESVRAVIAKQILSASDRTAAREIEADRLEYEKQKFFWNTPFVAALAGLVTLTATFAFNLVSARDDTTNTITLEEVQYEFQQSEARLKQELDTASTENLARLEAEAKEREFQYEIVRSELEKEGKTNAERAAVLLFLVRAGVLNALDRDELTLMAKLQQENPDQNIIPQLSSSVVGEGDFDRSLLFASDTLLTYAFMGEPTDAMVAAVEEAVIEWMKHANIRFELIENVEEAIIRIMPSDRRSTAMIGRQALSAPSDSPTMWLLERNQYDAAAKAQVLHEFGHVLGLVHEHQNPRADIPWNVEKAYEYFGSRQGWSRTMVVRNLLRKSEFYPCNREFDPQSIMMYFIPGEITVGGTEYRGGAQAISISDKRCVGEMYPR